MGALHILRAGALCTVQDLGRAGQGRLGVPPSGALDWFAHTLANRLVGNDDRAPTLEWTGAGGALRFVQPVWFALAGGDLGARLYDARGACDLLPGCARFVAAGADLCFERRVHGARAYVAVAGGVQAPLALGSASSDVGNRLGPAPLRRGDRLAVGPTSFGPPRAPGARVSGLRANPTLLRPVYQPSDVIRYVREDDGDLVPGVHDAFERARFAVTTQASRAALRMSTAPALPTISTPTRLSEAAAPGAVQLPPDGQPIVLLADRNTVGGYPRLGHVIAADEPRAAQLAPGDTVRFEAISVEDAHQALRDVVNRWPNGARC